MGRLDLVDLGRPGRKPLPEDIVQLVIREHKNGLTWPEVAEKATTLRPEDPFTPDAVRQIYRRAMNPSPKQTCEESTRTKPDSMIRPVLSIVTRRRVPGIMDAPLQWRCFHNARCCF